jgi:alpha-aminoadipic semialdehyde synthase
MSYCIGIRREDKNQWERRVPLTPDQIKKLKEEHEIDVLLQPSNIRVFEDAEYEGSGAEISEDMSGCPTVFAIKEVPEKLIESQKTYIFFGHVIKGQSHNMPLLRKMMNLGCNFIDYEKIVNEKGFRMIFFGNWAGLAGMANTLAAFGERLQSLDIENRFTSIKHAYQYKDHVELKEEVSRVGESIESEGLPKEIVPMVVGFAGYGNVSRGCQEVLGCLPVQEIQPEDLKDFMEKEEFSNKVVYKVVFKEWHMVEPASEGYEFELQDYYDHPEKYRGIFSKHVPYLTVLMNCIYWDKPYPRLVTKELVKNLKMNNTLRLKIIGDISCDINGAIEFTEKATEIDNPTFLYNPENDEITDGVSGDGIVVMAVDNLPCELPKESSSDFGSGLMNFVPEIAKCDFSREFADLQLSPPVKKALILHNGKLTPDYDYLNKFL